MIWVLALAASIAGTFLGLRRLRRKWVHDELEEIEIRALRGRSELEKQVTSYRVERAELETVLNAISEAVLAVDSEGNSRYFNAQFQHDFGGKDFGARKPRLGGVFRAPEIIELFARVTASRAPELLSIPLHTLERGMRDFNISATPLSRSPSGGAVGVFHDVTEIRRAEKVRIDFVANVSHELRTPMTSIKGYAETLQSELAGQEPDSLSRKCADVISRNTDRLMELVDDLMDLSAIESKSDTNDAAFSRAHVDVAELTERVLQQVELLRKEKSHRIDVQIQAKELMGDSRRVEQVLRNLVENAIRYVPEGGEITIKWEPIAAPNAPGTRLRVIDNGPGISAEHQTRVFERFYRVDPGRSRQMGGTGLGLAIVKHIMLRHGGSVNIVSAAGRGTEFFCDFPS